MTSKEIQANILRLNDDGTMPIKERMLGEIAFQLAKLNEHFERVDGEVFGTSVEGKRK
jgi:hypothetical protein